MKLQHTGDRVGREKSSPQTGVFATKCPVNISLFMTTEGNLQLLYDQLFGVDDQDEDNMSLITSDTQQADSHMHASSPATSVKFHKPAGLLLFKGWLSQQQQVRSLILGCESASARFFSVLLFRKLSWHASTTTAG